MQQWEAQDVWHEYWGDRDGRVEIFDPAERAAYTALMEQVDSIAFVGHAAPASLFFQAGRQDTIVPVDLLTQFVTTGSEPKVVKWYDADHGLDNAAQSDRADWLVDKLNLPPAS